jgi:hypothetical protein
MLHNGLGLDGRPRSLVEQPTAASHPGKGLSSEMTSPVRFQSPLSWRESLVAPRYGHTELPGLLVTSSDPRLAAGKLGPART